MPKQDPTSHDRVQRLRSLLSEVRAAKPDARGFALFERRDALNKLGVPHAMTDGVDAQDDAILDKYVCGESRCSASEPLILFVWEGAADLEGGEGAGGGAGQGKRSRVWRRGAWNNIYDAERHARWAYRVAKEVGPSLAALYGAGHEFTELGQPFGEALMDLHNNGVGIGQARAGGAIPNRATPGLIAIHGRNAKYPSAPE